MLPNFEVPEHAEQPKTPEPPPSPETALRRLKKEVPTAGREIPAELASVNAEIDRLTEEKKILESALRFRHGTLASIRIDTPVQKRPLETSLTGEELKKTAEAYEAVRHELERLKTRRQELEQDLHTPDEAAAIAKVRRELEEAIPEEDRLLAGEFALEEEKEHGILPSSKSGSVFSRFMDKLYSNKVFWRYASFNKRLLKLLRLDKLFARIDRWARKQEQKRNEETQNRIGEIKERLQLKPRSGADDQNKKI